MPKKPRPAAVEAARYREDTAALSAMGKKGAEAANRVKAGKKSLAEVEAALRAERDAADRRAMDEQANYHILDPDGNPPLGQE